MKKIQSAKLDGKQKNEAENRVREIEEEIGEEVSEENVMTLKETLQLMGVDSDSVNGKDRKQIWNLLKTKYPKILPAVPTGKKDHKGNIVTNHLGLKKLYLQTYEHRLRNRPIRKDFEEIMQLRNDLFSIRLKLSQNRKSLPWKMEDLQKVLNALKKNKARDPNGWISELFKEGVAGKDLTTSMLTFFNKIKSENYIADFIRKSDVATIYKGKGEKNNLENDRGIVLVTISKYPYETYIF